MSVFLTAIKNVNNTDDRLVTVPLSINNSGYTKIDSANISTCRPNGRKDYQLVYIKSGLFYIVSEDGTERPVPKDNIVIYRPYEYQHYKLYKQDNTEFFWIHFGGTWSEKLLEELHISEDLRYFKYEHADAFISTVHFIMNTLRKNERYGEMSCTAKLLELFSVIGRRDEATVSTNTNTALMDKICLDIANNYFLETSNEEYALKYGMSVSYFIKSFKATTGTTPQQYKSMLRFNNAENLLAGTDLKISEISHILGFSDSLYFSKFFSKLKGMSPTEFRNQSKKEK